MYRSGTRMGYAPLFTYRRSGGHHSERSDTQQQGKEEAEAGQEQEERRRIALTVRRHAKPGQTRHLVREPIRQEALAGDHRARPQRSPCHFGDDRANMRRPTSDQVRRQPHDKAAHPLQFNSRVSICGPAMYSFQGVVVIINRRAPCRLPLWPIEAPLAQTNV